MSGCIETIRHRLTGKNRNMTTIECENRRCPAPDTPKATVRCKILVRGKRRFAMVFSSEAPLLRKKIVSALLFAVASMLCAGCGSPSHSDTLSTAQAQAISQQVSQAVARSEERRVGKESR